ncbi:hypothetical protein ACFRFL_42850 [Streptomyces sp. NPDC056708]|uniref:hypothetical protein n=1 Tax=unclassified Streptomyces TaxID=2593676 RepID=UPI0036B400CB
MPRSAVGVVVVLVEGSRGKVLDRVMAALNASVKAAKEARGEDATVHEMRPSRKTPAKKTAPAKKGCDRDTRQRGNGMILKP